MFSHICGKLGGVCGYLGTKTPKIKHFSRFRCGKRSGKGGKVLSVTQNYGRIM
jgi:hypothetical protein